MSAPLEAAIAASTTSLSADVMGAAQGLATLALVASVAWLVLRLRAQGLSGRAQGQQLQVEERVVLDPRSALVIVRVEDRRLLLATSDQGAARLIAELAPTRPRSPLEVEPA